MTADPRADMSHDLLRQERQPLDVFFSPRTVAVVGATETAGSVGRTILWNLINSPFGGTVFPVNPKRPSVLGIKAYATLADVPAKVDLAVIVTPATAVPGLVGQCADLQIPGAVIISAGFREVGAAGAELERRTLAEARRGRMRLIGPNCLGVMSPVSGLNATFAAAMARPGNVAFLSQSGALLTAILDWSLKVQLGFSAFVSLGTMLDVGWGDLIDHFGNDPRTRSIVLYMESIGDDARGFLSAAREVALTKPIIVIKAGRTEAAARAAASHTGALTGSDEVLDAAFRRTGVLRVSQIGDVFDMAEVLGKQPRPRGPRLTVVTNAGGPGVLATDALITHGGELAPLSDDTRARLDTLLPAAWSHGNPIDVLGDAPPARYAGALEIAAADPDNDGLLVVLTPQDMTDPTLTAQALTRYAKVAGKPVLASWMGGAQVAAGIDILNRANIPTFAFPDAAARAFCYMWRSSYGLRALYETPAPGQVGAADAVGAAGIIEAARADGRTLLDEVESKRLLAAYGIPVTDTRVATTAADARAAAVDIGFPVAVKLYSRTLTHKTDVGGVKLGLADGDAVARAFDAIRASVTERAGAQHFLGVTVQPMARLSGAYELILGASPDRQFGPVLLFGAGGQLVEVFRDRALALPPLNRTLARRMMEQTLIFRALQGVRGQAPVNMEALEELLVRFSELVVDHPWIKELDINPLLASPDGLLAVDARVVLHDPATRREDLPRPAIRPYPAQYAQPHRLPDGTDLMVRPIRPEDEAMMIDFHRTLSESTVRQRYLAPLQLDLRTTHERLIRVCFSDYDRDIALVVEHRPVGAAPEIVAVGRLSRRSAHDDAEFAILVRDAWQRRGLGTELLRRIVAVARAERIPRVTATMLPDNVAMMRIASHLGFTVRCEFGDAEAVAEISLGS
ncbi:MAG TPA: bifunctional acetate--CoA ligase family protein/GNAT family N-acetyltransferase [Polyangia bacterium]|nr:bifunctional acetate--CoA ligase family protein/GNAT family N-acetyltransferase [Polyangia bacterium]